MEIQKIATREGYGKALLELGRINKNVVVVDADLGDSTKAEYFGKEFPERFFTMGIAEQDMIGAAAGLSVSGKIPYASTFAVFSERAFEFVRNIVARNKLNVKICGSHAGITTGEDGKSAQALEDVAIYRSLPNMVVLQPSDAAEAEKMVFALADYKGPSYMRVHRTAYPIIHDKNYKFEIGKGEILRQGKVAVIFASGTMVHESIIAADILKNDNIEIYVVNIHTIKPIDSDLIIDLAKKTNCVVTAEDHNVIGGLGSAVAEVLSENYPCLMKRIGMKDKFGESGKPEELYKKYGLDSQSVADEVKKFLGKKNH
ncbi:MAG TPA: transketolase family protein [Candidatus Nanoarchaeia archaeon]|nr:transketolase family protein [Candidatus Nanoarchaeia archaeon]